MKQSILVVDDEPMTRDLLRLMLGTLGFSVREAVDGIDALEKLQEFQPDLIVLDVMMPRMDGLTLCRKVRADKTMADLPIIILTARADHEAQMASEAIDKTRFLAKPASRSDLLSHINEVLAPNSSQMPIA